MATPTPGLAPSAPVPSGASQATGMTNDQLASVMSQMLSAQGGRGGSQAVNPFVGSSSTKPDTAFESYGPLSVRTTPDGEYQHGSSMPPYRVTKPVADMANEYYTWSDDQKQAFRAKMSLIDKSALTAPDNTMAQMWADYVQQSANYLSAGVSVSPMDILSRDLSIKGNAGPKTTTQTTTDTTLTSRADANAMFKTAAQSLLGRDPTPQEADKFADLLAQQESQNPTTATITTSTDEQGNVKNQTRTTQGGFNQAAADALAKQVAQQSPDYGANAANNYMKVLMGLVGVK